MKRTGLAAVMEGLDGVELSGADSARCADLLLDVKLMRGWLDATEARITARMTVRHDSAGAAPAADVHTRCGGVSTSEGKRKERRSKALGDAPEFGRALADGVIGSEHVDTLANATAKLDDELKASLLGHTHDLLGTASSKPPDKFARHLRDRVRTLERDNGLDRNQRQRSETFLSRKLNRNTGMIEGRFAFHPELGNQVFGPVDREVASIIASGERQGDPAFTNRAVDRNRVAAEALGNLVAGGHQATRPVEAEITVIVDEHTLATGDIDDSSVCETSEGLDLPTASAQRLLSNGRVTPTPHLRFR